MDQQNSANPIACLGIRGVGLGLRLKSPVIQYEMHLLSVLRYIEPARFEPTSRPTPPTYGDLELVVMHCEGMPLRHAVAHQKHAGHGLAGPHAVVGKVWDGIAVMRQEDPAFARRPTQYDWIGRTGQSGVLNGGTMSSSGQSRRSPRTMSPSKFSSAASLITKQPLLPRSSWQYLAKLALGALACLETITSLSRQVLSPRPGRRAALPLQIDCLHADSADQLEAGCRIELSATSRSKSSPPIKPLPSSIILT